MEHGSRVAGEAQCLISKSAVQGASGTGPTVVLDTNVVLDWLVFHDARVAALTQALTAGRLRAIAAPPMRVELAHMLASARLLRWAPDAEAALRIYDETVRMWTTDATQGPWPAGRPRCSDQDDQVFIDLALAGRAQWLLTHDRALLRLARRMRAHGVAVLTPMVWATRTGAGAMAPAGGP